MLELNELPYLTSIIHKLKLFLNPCCVTLYPHSKHHHREKSVGLFAAGNTAGGHNDAFTITLFYQP